MLKKLYIKNFKSVLEDTISLGRINIFIGENGCGKSNILEALMFAAMAETYGTVDTSILSLNGIRVAKPSLILSSFKNREQSDKFEVKLSFSTHKDEVVYSLSPADKNEILSKWTSFSINENLLNEYLKKITTQINDAKIHGSQDNELKKIASKLIEELEIADELTKEKFNKTADYKNLLNFIIYTLNTDALRGVGINKSKKGIYGEYLDIFINELTKEETKELNEYLYTISWLDSFFIDTKDEYKKKGFKLNQSDSKLYFKDKFMQIDNNLFSAENSNEGVLHILFYLVNIISSKTPNLFAIDNIETSLNPHLCRHVMEEIVELSKKHEKQILITTHNPAVLDGLILFDDEIRLFEVFRTNDGDTKTRRIQLKPSVKDQNYKLSELWTRGFLGAISQNFY